MTAGTTRAQNRELIIVSLFGEDILRNNATHLIRGRISCTHVLVVKVEQRHVINSGYRYAIVTAVGIMLWVMVHFGDKAEEIRAERESDVSTWMMINIRLFHVLIQHLLVVGDAGIITTAEK